MTVAPSICAARPSTAALAPVLSIAADASEPDPATVSYPCGASASATAARRSCVSARASAAARAPARGSSGSTATRFSAAAAEAKSRNTANVRKGTSIRMFRAPEGHGKLRNALQSQEKAHLSGDCVPRVLVIDDEPLVALMVQRALAEAHEVGVDHSAHSCVARFARGERWDVIIADPDRVAVGKMQVGDAIWV